jgi:polar amino acid transport system substrate-binding protein
MQFPKPLSAFVLTVVLSMATYAADDSATPLRVGITPNTPPMVFKEGGRLTGMEIEFAENLATELGRPLKFIELKWEDQIDALLDNKTDIIMSSMSITRPRQYRIAFSTPYLRVGQMALVRAEDVNRYAIGFPQPLPGVVGVVKATTGDYLVQQEFSRSKRKLFTSGEEAATALAKKRIDVFIADSSLIWWLAAANESRGLAAVPMALTQEDLAWGMRRSDVELQKSVNAFLKKLQESGRASQIIKHWLPNAR